MTSDTEFDSIFCALNPCDFDVFECAQKWVLEQSEPKILLSPRVGSKEREYHLYLKKNDWKGLTVAMKYIVHDVILEAENGISSLEEEEEESTSTPIPYTITILNDRHIGSNLSDIQWLCQIVSSNLALKSLRISRCKNLLEFNKFHFLLQNGFLMEEANTWSVLEEVSIDSHREFNDECFKLLMDVIERKCPSVTTLCLCRTAISNESVKELLAFLDRQSDAHPLWNIDIEFCPHIDDDALRLIFEYLQRNPLKHFYVKCTGKTLFPDRVFEDQRLSISVYPT